MTVTLLVIVTETLLVTRILKVTVTETETDGDSMFVVYRQFVTIDLVKLPSCQLSPIAEICVVASEFIK